VDEQTIPKSIITHVYLIKGSLKQFWKWQKKAQIAPYVFPHQTFKIPQNPYKSTCTPQY
jgi:hypothetical protein